MKRVRILAIGALLALASGTAMAFDVQQGAKAPAESGAAAPVQSDNLGANLSLSETTQSQPGTEVRIPGLGRLGVLPKMDFGLELLYGATETRQQPATPSDPADDLAIRGSVKHRF